MNLINKDALVGKTVLVFDIETTGFDKKANQIIEIAGIRINPDGTEVEFQEFCHAPHVPHHIEEITGINTKMLEKARSEQEVIDDFKEQMVKGVDFIVAHNGKSFDLPFSRGRDSSFFKDVNKGYALLDTLLLAKVAMPLSENFQLTTLAKSLGHSGNGAHRALDDVKMTWFLAQKLLDNTAVEQKVVNEYENAMKALKEAEKVVKKVEKALAKELQDNNTYILFEDGVGIGVVPEHEKEKFDTTKFQKDMDDTILSTFQATRFDSKMVKEKSPNLYDKYLVKETVPTSVKTRRIK